MVELCAAVTGVYLGWSLLAVYPRRAVRLSRRLLQDTALLVGLSFLLLLACREVAAGLVLALVAYVMYQDLPAPHIGVAERAVVVTGCDRGLGHRLAIQLDAKGFQVFAACLFPEGDGAKSLVSQCSSRLSVLHLDVSNPVQVEAAARMVATRLGSKVLHGVVNNAGIMHVGSLELMTLEDIRKVMEVNFYGTVHVCRAFLPLLRRRPRLGTARIVNVASNIGLAPSCLGSVYGASKSAVAIVNETLRYELKPLGIDVVTIIPSGFRTGIQKFEREKTAERWWNAATEEAREYYGWECFHIQERSSDPDSYLNPDFTPITNCMVDGLLSKHPRPFYYKGILARSWPFLFLHLPSSLWDKVMPYIGDHYRFRVNALQQQQQHQQPGGNNNDDDANKKKA